MKSIKVLMILPTFDYAGGIESFVMNNIRLFPDDIRVDILSHYVSASDYVEEINMRGGKVYKLIPFSLSSLRQIKYEYEKILEQGNYDIVHCHMANAAFLYLKIAKKHGIKNRILHSHQEKAADTFTHAMRNYPLLAVGRCYSTKNVACSQNAGNFLFGIGNFQEIDNGIDYEKYRFDESKRDSIRSSLCIDESDIAVVHTGRFCPQKNQIFLLEVFKRFVDIRPNAKLFLVGDGEDREKIEEWIKENKFSEKVEMLGKRTDIDKILSGMDLFVFPSLYEGLPISLLEAQASSIPCVCSNTIPIEADISGRISFVSLKESFESWAEILNEMLERYKRISVIDLRERHSIRYSSNELIELYRKCICR